MARRWPGRGVWTLAARTLVHDRTKFLVASAGVSVSVLLVLAQVGLYLGFMANASALVDHSRADLWVAGAGTDNFDFAAPIDERLLYRVASTPGVAQVEPLLLGFGQFKLPTGGLQGVQVVGLARAPRLLAPWNVVEGDWRRLAEEEGIVIDTTEVDKLLVSRVGARAEITGVRARVVALTQGLRSFTTSPFVFTNSSTARAYTGLGATQITYVLARAAPGEDLRRVRERLSRLPHVEVFTSAELSARARAYWSARTGVGAGFFATAAMGIVVGLVVVGQVLYSGTLEQLREYATLKAVGVENRVVVAVILAQAGISAGVGVLVGGALAFAARAAMRSASLKVALSPGLLLATALVTFGMCGAAALLSVRKVLRLDPASVFRG